MSWDIRTGHVLDLLAAMPAESVQCVVTSPPYFGLRAYGTEPVTWGGDPGCGHAWVGAIRPGQSGGTASAKVQIKGQANFQITPDREHATCTRCGAWRGELGSEPTPALFVAHLVECFRAVRRVLRPDGCIFINIGDSYGGSGRGWGGGSFSERANQWEHCGSNTKPSPGRAKSLHLIPERLALALSDDGWIVRSRIAWCKQAPMPESVRDRPTSAWEHVWMLSKWPRYFWDQEAVREGASENTHSRGAGIGIKNATIQRDGTTKHNADYARAINGPVANRNLRNYWLLPPDPFPGAHFAVFPKRLAEIAILAATSERGACTECGAPWARNSGPTAEYQETLDRLKSDPAWKGERRTKAHLIGNAFGSRATRDQASYETTGWAPGCRHATAPTRPCVVLDPFSGAGTVALVADRLGRHGIGLELNPEYAELSRRRITDDAPLLAALSKEED